MPIVNFHLILGDTVSMICPARVVEDRADGLLLWIAPGTPVWRAALPPGAHLRDLPPGGSYPLRASRWRRGGALILQPAGAGHAVWWTFTEEQEFRGWYVNLESRGREGADVHVTDQELDITVAPDRRWAWKDEESFAEKTGHPVYWTAAEAAGIRAEGVRVATLVESASYPFDGTWCDFRPPASWTLPELPELPIGPVTAPSGVLVLGKAGWIGRRQDGAPPRSESAFAVAATGGGHLHDGGAEEPEPYGYEAVAVPAAADRPLPVRARTSPSPFDGELVVCALEISLGLPWDHAAHGAGPVALGDLPVDRRGMLLGDARALDAFEGLDGESVDGPAGRLRRAGRDHTLLAGVVEVGGCRVLGLGWDPGDHSMRHRGERASGRVHPATLEERAGEAVLRWAIPPYEAHGEAPWATEDEA
ncbi:DUF402 domain-containing protein [Streptomyces sp. ISL-43]|uniref:DUF402 domain-containing protein n=1 Tax=Streptomyces sp. ISL-43 TaxID=2819183 RepID=UPI0020350BD1|nr:DUF402 domain-containing protein [Streptomyces sp. ISL-43]